MSLVGCESLITAFPGSTQMAFHMFFLFSQKEAPTWKSCEDREALGMQEAAAGPWQLWGEVPKVSLVSHWAHVTSIHPVLDLTFLGPASEADFCASHLKTRIGALCADCQCPLSAASQSEQPRRASV